MKQLLFALCFFAQPTLATPIQSKVDTIYKLSLSDFKELQLQCDATLLHQLSNNLKIVSQSDIDNEKEEAWRVIWSLRALRFLTNKKFTSSKPTDHPNTLSEFLFSSDGAMWFFGVWMSRDKIFVSPPSQQKDIISQWTTYIDEATCSEAEVSIDFWYF